MYIGQRIRHIRKENHLSQSEFSEKIGCSQAVLSLMENNQASVSVDTIIKVSQAFNVSSEWLMFGKQRYDLLSIDNAYIPLVDIEARAGYLENSKDKKYLDGLRLYKIPGFETGEDHRIFEVEGDSMAPTLLPSDKVICHLIDGIEFIAEGTLSVIVTNTDVVTKRIYFKDPSRKVVLCKSDNENYKPYTIPVKDIIEVWSVKAKITTSFVEVSFAQATRIDKLESEVEEIKSRFGEMLEQFTRLRPKK